MSENCKLTSVISVTSREKLFVKVSNRQYHPSLPHFGMLKTLFAMWLFFWVSHWWIDWSLKLTLLWNWNVSDEFWFRERQNSTSTQKDSQEIQQYRWWIVFVVWLTDKRHLVLSAAGTIVRDPHHHDSLKRR